MRNRRSERTEECFPFGMSSDQLVQLEAILTSELVALSPEIQASYLSGFESKLSALKLTPEPSFTHNLLNIT